MITVLNRILNTEFCINLTLENTCNILIFRIAYWLAEIFIKKHCLGLGSKEKASIFAAAKRKSVDVFT
jgi:hypothetical protein